MIEIGKIYKKKEDIELMDNFRLETPKKIKKSLKNKKNPRTFSIYNISKHLNCRQDTYEGRYRATNFRNAAKKAYDNKTRNSRTIPSLYVSVYEKASNQTKTYKITGKNIELIDTCVKNSKKKSKKNNRLY